MVNFVENFDDKVVCVDKDKSKDWILDLGTCIYICNQKEVFIDCKGQSGNVKYADGGDLHVKDIGSVRLKMYDRRVEANRSWAHIIN